MTILVSWLWFAVFLLSNAAQGCERLTLAAQQDLTAISVSCGGQGWISQHDYSDQFSRLPWPKVASADLSFGFSASESIFKSIVNKALDTISEREELEIVSQWLRFPETKVGTWERYNKSFYLVILFGTLLILSSLIWAIYLFGEVRKRKRSQRMLVRERNNAQKAYKENREFLSRMSHEIRTPVSAIMGFLELLQLSSAPFSQEDKLCIDQAAKASRSLLTLIGEVLDLEKIESGILEAAPEWGNVDNLINGKIALFQALAIKKGIRLHYHSQLNPNDMILLDYQLLGQVLNNLIGNALKFTQQGSVNMAAQYNAGNLIISIKDTGPGISRYDQHRLFNTFYQGEAISDQQGSGLGLAISKALMHTMGGAILLQSKLQHGTTLTLNLPVKVSQHYLNPKPKPLLPARQAHNNIRVLIVDDQAASRLLLLRQLEILGIKAQQAEDGQQALKLMQQGQFALVITDINMPVIDGIALAKMARSRGVVSFICGLTATAQEHERQRCLAAGMDDCLFKPVNVSQLSMLLSRIETQVHSGLDMARLTMLTQGNRVLMLRALQDAQQENYSDLAAIRVGIKVADYSGIKFHIHRINGTALLLGASSLALSAQQFEERLSQAIDLQELFPMLDSIEDSLAAIEIEIANFIP